MARSLHLVNPFATIILQRLIALVSMASACGLAQAIEGEVSCLYAVSIGPAQLPVTACGPMDPLDIGSDPKVHLAMKLMGVPRDSVEFRGCPGAHFMATEDHSGSDGGRYIVRYPTEVGSRFLAPIIHELAHVMQMSAAGGLSHLRGTHPSIKIELSADFLVGYTFGRVLPQIDRDQFQHNLSLVGAYVERSEAAHGTPAQRTQAFRLGAVGRYPYSQLEIRRAYEYFLQNDVARFSAAVVK